MMELKLESQLIYNGKIIDVKIDKVQLPSGRETSREVVVHPGAVAVVAVTDNNEILLIKQFRYPVGEILWEIPAGKLEKGEKPDTCAGRELAEETGYGAGKLVHLSTFYTTPGFSDEIMYLYMAYDLFPQKLDADDDEFIEISPVPFRDALAMIEKGEIKDAKTIIGILMAAKSKKEL